MLIQYQGGHENEDGSIRADQKRVLKMHTKPANTHRQSITLAQRTKMKRKTAPIPERKPAGVFMAGNSQTVRLPQEFRFNTNRVALRREGETLGLGSDELAFYDALETSDSAVQVLGDETLRLIAWELVRTVRNNVSIDWTRRESLKAKLRAAVKRILNKYDYPPDKREKATETVLEQAEVLSAAWAEEPPPVLGFRPFPKRGDGVVTNELIDRLREETGD